MVHEDILVGGRGVEGACGACQEEEGYPAAAAVEGGGGPHVVLAEGVPVQLGGNSIDIWN